MWRCYNRKCGFKVFIGKMNNVEIHKMHSNAKDTIKIKRFGMNCILKEKSLLNHDNIRKVIVAHTSKLPDDVIKTLITIKNMVM
jgi:hypothetical protein